MIININDFYQKEHGVSIPEGYNLLSLLRTAIGLARKYNEHSTIVIPKGNYTIAPSNSNEFYKLGDYRGNLTPILKSGIPYETLALLELTSNITIEGEYPPEDEFTPLTKLTFTNDYELDNVMLFIMATSPSEKMHENIHIKNIEFSLSRESLTSGHGALFLQDTDTTSVSKCKVSSMNKKKYGQGIHLLGCQKITLYNNLFHSRISGITAFYVNNLIITNNKFVKFNEAIDLDKGCNCVIINNNYFWQGSKYSNEAIDSNGTNWLIISNNQFITCGRVLYFNGKINITNTYHEWQQVYPDKLENTVFVGGRNLLFCNNTIRDCYSMDTLKGVVVIGNKWTYNKHPNVPSPVNLWFSGNNYHSSGCYLFYESHDCTIVNENHKNSVGTYFLRGKSEPSANTKDSTLELHIENVTFTTNPDNDDFIDVMKLDNIGVVNVLNCTFNPHKITTPPYGINCKSYRPNGTFTIE